MKFYHSPSACSLGTHILLEESGLSYEPVVVSLREGAQLKPEYLAINPKGKVPALGMEDGTTLTEWMAIATYIAAQAPQANLVPDGALARARTEEVCSYVLMTMHLQGFGRIFRPERFSPVPESQAVVKETGEKIFRDGFALLDRQLAGRDWVAGAYSMADAAVFYVENWGTRVLKWALPGNVAAHHRRMRDRPAVARALEAEGLA